LPPITARLPSGIEDRQFYATARYIQLFLEEQITAFETDRDGIGCSAHVSMATKLLLKRCLSDPVSYSVRWQLR
jgi:hypothetical protein